MSLKDVIDGCTACMNDFDYTITVATPVNSHVIHLDIALCILCHRVHVQVKGKRQRKTIISTLPRLVI